MEVKVGKQQLIRLDVKSLRIKVLEEECLQEYQFPAVELTNLEGRTGSLMRKVVCEWHQVQSVVQQRMNPHTQSLRHFLSLDHLIGMVQNSDICGVDLEWFPKTE